jgi:hypothetical protein
MNFIPKKVISNNPPIIKTSLPNLDTPLPNETIKLTYENICDVVIKDIPQFTQASKSIQSPPQQQQQVDKPIQTTKTAHILEPGQTTLDNYVSVSKIQPKRLTKSAKVSAVQHELTVSPQTVYRRIQARAQPIKQAQSQAPVQPIKQTQAPVQPIKQTQAQAQPIKQAQSQSQAQPIKQTQTQTHVQPIKQAQAQPNAASSVVIQGKTFDNEPPIYRGKNPFHEITLKSSKSKKKSKSKKNNKFKKSKKNNKSKLKKKEKRRQTQSLSTSGGNPREIISKDIQNIMSLF